MDSNQTTIQLKPMYPISHMSLYNAPVLSATMSNITLASGLNIVDATTNGTTTTSVAGQTEINNNNVNNNFNAEANNIQITAETTNSAQLVPITINNVCLSNLQIQQIQHQSSFGQNQFDATRNSNGHQQNQQQENCNQLLQIQLAASTTIANGISTSNSEVQSRNTTTTTNGQDILQQNVGDGTNTIPDSMSNLSNESSTSTFSETINPGEMTNSSSSATKGSSSKKEMDITGTSYVDLAKASCSSNGIISMKLGSSDSSSSHTSYRSCLGKGFKCQICNRDFTQKGNLKTHLMTHSGERPYECQTCGKNFTQKGNLDTHVKIHTETKDHKCQYCDRGFTQRGNLKTHIRSIHTKEKPYACGHCGKAFSQKGNMLTHYRTHDKEARFPCNVCGKTFSQKGNLKTHQQRHGRSSGR